MSQHQLQTVVLKAGKRYYDGDTTKMKYRMDVAEYHAVHKDSRGVFSNPEYPDFVGKRTLLINENGITTLIIEGPGFEIVGDGGTSRTWA